MHLQRRKTKQQRRRNLLPLLHLQAPQKAEGQNSAGPIDKNKRQILEDDISRSVQVVTALVRRVAGRDQGPVLEDLNHQIDHIDHPGAADHEPEKESISTHGGNAHQGTANAGLDQGGGYSVC